MAVYRLHRKTWEKSVPQPPHASSSNAKRKRGAPGEAEDEDADPDEDPDTLHGIAEPSAPSSAKRRPKARKDAPPSEYPGGGRKGVSSGLSTVIKRKDARSKSSASAWWKDLGGGSKGSVKL